MGRCFENILDIIEWFKRCIQFYYAAYFLLNNSYSNTTITSWQTQKLVTRISWELLKKINDMIALRHHFGWHNELYQPMQSLFRLINVFYLCASIEASFKFEGFIFSVAFDMHSRQNYIYHNIYIKIVYRNRSYIFLKHTEIS